ncbi:hypothetical protein VNO77_19781 [Canavalia gladiata]|uniref:Uncharacterized protein n=1 Tax=Canavalia gladiata TaxID=3824 RepID=A0AAN9LN59_CANGL
MRSGGLLAYWISKPRNFSNGANADQVAGWLTGLANQGITVMVLVQIRGLVAGWLTGLANQGITAMVLMQIRLGGWLAYWISKPRNYSNGASADQGAGWLTGLANQGTTAMVLVQIRGLGAGWLTGLANQGTTAMVLVQIRGLVGLLD